MGTSGTFFFGIWALLWHINTLTSVSREGANGAEAFVGGTWWTPAIAIQVEAFRWVLQPRIVAERAGLELGLHLDSGCDWLCNLEQVK